MESLGLQAHLSEWSCAWYKFLAIGPACLVGPRNHSVDELFDLFDVDAEGKIDQSSFVPGKVHKWSRRDTGSS